MAKATDDRGHGTLGAGHNPLAGFNNIAAPNIEPLIQASTRLLETWMAMTTEILEMSRVRIDRSVEMSRALAKSSSITEVIDIQTKFAQTMMRDYMASANKIASLGTRGLADDVGQTHAPSAETDRSGSTQAMRAAAE
jgi:hypothetical protein